MARGARRRVPHHPDGSCSGPKAVRRRPCAFSGQSGTERGEWCELIGIPQCAAPSDPAGSAEHAVRGAHARDVSVLTLTRLSPSTQVCLAFSSVMMSLVSNVKPACGLAGPGGSVGRVRFPAGSDEHALAELCRLHWHVQQSPASARRCSFSCARLGALNDHSGGARAGEGGGARRATAARAWTASARRVRASGFAFAVAFAASCATFPI